MIDMIFLALFAHIPKENTTKHQQRIYLPRPLSDEEDHFSPFLYNLTGIKRLDLGHSKFGCESENNNLRTTTINQF